MKRLINIFSSLLQAWTDSWRLADNKMNFLFFYFNLVLICTAKLVVTKSQNEYMLGLLAQLGRVG